MTAKLTITKANPTVTAPTAKELTYTGEALELINAGTSTHGTFEYKLTGEYSDSLPKATDVGTYKVFYKFIGDENHNDIEEKELSVTIAKTDITDFTLPTANALTYTGDDQELINAGTSTQGTFKYKLNADAEYVENLPKATNAGSYTVYYIIVGDSNHNDKEGTIPASIAKANPTVTAPTAIATLAYTSQEQVLINAGSTNGGTLVYKLGDGEYSENLPVAISAGTYTIYYKVIGNDNYNDTEEASIQVTIQSKTIPTVTAPTAISGLIYTGVAQSLINAGTTTGGTLYYSTNNIDYSTDMPTGINAGTYTIYYKVIGDDIYADVAPQYIQVTIAQKSITGATINLQFEEYTYTGSAIEPTVSSVYDGLNLIATEDYIVSYDANAINIGNYKVTITGTKETNRLNTQSFLKTKIFH